MAALSSPMQFQILRTHRIMLLVLLATTPAIAVASWFFGYGVLLNIVFAVTAAVSCEAIILKLRYQSVRAHLADNSVLVTALLFALAVPPGSPWWLLTLGIVFAVALAKHAYGGLGNNVFNPAMAGYLFLLLAFPLEMTTWHLPLAAIETNTNSSPLSWHSLTESVGFLFPFVSELDSFDGMAMATPLIEYKLASNSAVLEASREGLALFDRSSGTGWELVNFAYLLGGLCLFALGIISWHIPVAIITTVLLLSLLFYAPGNTAVIGTPYLHLFGSATMIAAFFIATDPVTAATSNPAKLVYGIIIGCAIYSIRVWGSYLDSIAIAVLFGNFCAPLLDHTLRPRIFGRGLRRQKHE